MKELYELKNEDGERIVDKNEKIVFRMKIFKPTEFNVPSDNVTTDVDSLEEVYGDDDEVIEEGTESRDLIQHGTSSLDFLLECLEYVV